MFFSSATTAVAVKKYCGNDNYFHLLLFIWERTTL
uniref:Uncharacterized protein n=1 Tax=Myoviridae sp. ctGBP5 TaxID=2825071 RepID=A0A8S5PAF7_9CAUD|nr:MAG TPA: hypothetical protein [Myoviridae sp. ctGBP5]